MGYTHIWFYSTQQIPASDRYLQVANTCKWASRQELSGNSTFKSASVCSTLWPFERPQRWASLYAQARMCVLLCAFERVCLYVHVRESLYVLLCACVCVPVRACTCACVCLCVCMCVCVPVRACACACMSVRVCVCLSWGVCVCACVKASDYVCVCNWPLDVSVDREGWMVEGLWHDDWSRFMTCVCVCACVCVGVCVCGCDESLWHVCTISICVCVRVCVCLRLVTWWLKPLYDLCVYYGSAPYTGWWSRDLCALIMFVCVCVHLQAGDHVNCVRCECVCVWVCVCVCAPHTSLQHVACVCRECVPYTS